MNIYAGNLPFDISEDELRKEFEEFGEVTEVRLIMDKFSGKSKGFGFIEMPSKEDAEKAIAELNGKEYNGRTINVNEARPKIERSSRGKRGGGKRGGGPRRGGFGGKSRGGFGNSRGGRY